ncbi:Gustatory and odorant receptor 24 [Frankliniella fusca]|uniref:Gustatory receptor n=1 Tax=Frankliniella fusca TaxID=407009 RepID=A0AAE1LCH5_9NEOP|nr:Gustatory and odorant receptor 24 [Frankliniella fusca]
MLRQNAIAPVIWTLAAIGVMPMVVHQGAGARRGWRRLLPRTTLPLCVLIFALFSASGVQLVLDHVPLVMAQDADMDRRMMSTELIAHMLPLLGVPCGWLHSRSICRMSIDYLKTKRMIYAVTQSSGRRDARLRRLYTATTAALVALSVAMPATAYVMVDRLNLKPAHQPCLQYGLLVQTLVVWNVVIQLLQLGRLASCLRRHFARVAPAASAATVRTSRELWMRLREHYGYDDDSCHVAYVLNMLYLLCQCTFVSFEAFSFYATGDFWACLGHGTFSLMYLVEIYAVCECAHRAVYMMKEPFVAILDRMSLGRLDQETYHEVCFFYNTIITQTPTYSIRGYTALNRSFLASIFMAILSYLVFLAQCKDPTLPRP